MNDVVCAFKAHMGWINTVAVLRDAAQPTPVVGERIEFVPDDDREARAPYHVAGGWQGLEQSPRPPHPERIIERGLRRQAQAAEAALAAFKGRLEAEGLAWRKAVMLVGRGWLGHSLEEILAYHAHIVVAEAEAMRTSARAAFQALGLTAVDQDEKSVVAAASVELGVSEGACDQSLKDKRPPHTRNWSKEERLVALAAWLCRQ